MSCSQGAKFPLLFVCQKEQIPCYDIFIRVLGEEVNGHPHKVEKLHLSDVKGNNYRAKSDISYKMKPQKMCSGLSKKFPIAYPRGNVLLADALLLQFCRRIECLFSNDSIAPNNIMHIMHAHLKACIENYGPINSVCIKRYNGILESLPNNNRCIEPQMMK